MSSITYNKLIRDLIPQIIEKSSKKTITKIASEDIEYIGYLDNKLEEELEEYKRSGDIEELADLQEVIYALVKVRGLSLDDFESLRLKKREERGGFHKRVVLLEVIDEQ